MRNLLSPLLAYIAEQQRERLLFLADIANDRTLTLSHFIAIITLLCGHERSSPNTAGEC